MTMLSKAALLKPKTTRVAVGDGYVTIKAMTAAYAASLRGVELDSARIFQVIADSMVDENGATFLTAEDVGNIAIIDMNEIVAGVFAFNALGAKAVQQAQDELKKVQTEEPTTN